MGFLLIHSESDVKRTSQYLRKVDVKFRRGCDIISHPKVLIDKSGVNVFVRQKTQVHLFVIFQEIVVEQVPTTKVFQMM